MFRAYPCPSSGVYKDDVYAYLVLKLCILGSEISLQYWVFKYIYNRYCVVFPFCGLGAMLRLRSACGSVARTVCLVLGRSLGVPPVCEASPSGSGLWLVRWCVALCRYIYILGVCTVLIAGLFRIRLVCYWFLRAMLSFPSVVLFCFGLLSFCGIFYVLVSVCLLVYMCVVYLCEVLTCCVWLLFLGIV